MADTTKLKTKIEPFVRKELEKLYPGHTFTEKAVIVGRKKDGSPAFHKFDAVSEDSTIVVSIKSHSWKTSGGKRPAGKIGEIYQALYFLSLAQAKNKLLILTNRGTYDGFARESDGKMPGDVEIRLVTLPPKLQQLVNEVSERASKEIKQ